MSEILETLCLARVSFVRIKYILSLTNTLNQKFVLVKYSISRNKQDETYSHKFYKNLLIDNVRFRTDILQSI